MLPPQSSNSPAAHKSPVKSSWTTPPPPKSSAASSSGNCHQSPHPASCLLHHGLPRLARERLLELRHVHHDAVDSILWRRVRIRLHLQPHRFLAFVGAPHLPEGQEKPLLRREALDLRRVLPDRTHQRHQRNARSAIVRRVLAQG